MNLSDDLVTAGLIKYLESPAGRKRIAVLASRAIDEISQQTGETREQIISRYFDN